MSELNSAHFIVYHEEEDRRLALELKTLFEDEGIGTLDFLETEIEADLPFKIYLYKNEYSLLSRKYGSFPLFHPREKVLSTTLGLATFIVLPQPNSSDLLYHDLFKQALQEFLFRIFYEKYPGLSPWYYQGLISFFLDREIELTENQSFPSLAKLETGSLSELEASGSLESADAFIAYLLLTYKKEGLLAFLKSGGDYYGVFAHEPETVYLNWMGWLSKGKPDDPRLKPR